MTATSFSQSEVYQLFKDVDRIPGIMRPRLGRWRAWPIVKMQLVWPLMYPISALPANQGMMTKVKARLSDSWSDVSVALRQASRVHLAQSSGSIGMMYVPRLHRFSDGRTRDAIYGDLLHGDGLALPVVALEQQPWNVRHRRRHIDDRPIYLDPYQTAVDVLAMVLMGSPAVRAVARRLDAILGGTDLPVAPELRRRKLLLALAVFEARRRIFRRLLKRLGVRLLVVTYAPGRSGEIAAARELGIPTIELQHGVVSAHCPDYAWPAEYRSMRSEITVPDRTGLFGPLFCREIVRSGFWTETEALPLGSAAVEHYRPLVQSRARRPGPLRLAFMTQGTSRDVAVDFWRAFLTRERYQRLELLLKIHPEEAHVTGAYRALEAIAPTRVKVIPPEANTMDVILDADVVLSYNSMALLEALGLSRPAISICGGWIPAGFAGTFVLPEVRAIMPHVGSPDELASVLRERAADDDALAAWRAQASHFGKDCFSDGFQATATALINSMIEPRCTRASLH